jgi:arylsulfatase A-like enzyme
MVKNKSRIIKRGLGIVILINTITPAIILAQKSSVKPNVIIICTDDQGTIDANCFGAKDLYTPNIDRLSDSGVQFTQFYAAAAICSPSRAALLTGKTPLKAGLPGNAPAIRGESGLYTEQITIAETLKKTDIEPATLGNGI